MDSNFYQSNPKIETLKLTDRENTNLTLQQINYSPSRPGSPILLTVVDPSSNIVKKEKMEVRAFFYIHGGQISPRLAKKSIP